MAQPASGRSRRRQRRLTEATGLKFWSRATVVALLLGLCGVSLWGGRVEREAGLWFLPDTPVPLYFGTADAQGVGLEVRWLPRSAATPEGRVEALIEGPRSPHLVPSIPAGTRLRSVRRVGDLVTVDFSGQIAANHPGGSAGELVTVYSVVNTLTEMDGVERVQWLVDGKIVESLAGHMDLSRPIARNEEYIVDPEEQEVTG